MKTPACEHPEEEGCMYCCEACNYVKHLCPGCGADVPHGTVACADCTKEAQRQLMFDPNWCDWHKTVHDSIIVEHCNKGEHCTSTTAVCSADENMDDHANKCCDCGRPLRKSTITA